jgi:hypothetical protein
MIAGVAAWALLIAPSAQATVVTVGSPLTASFSPFGYGSVLTVSNLTFPEAGAKVTSPIDGIVVRWRITGASGGPFRLRVLTPVSGTTFTGAGTSAPQTPSSTATQTFTTNLPIKAGQTIGLNNTSGSDALGVAGGGTYTFWNPPLADNETRAGSSPTGLELGFNADVATIPSNADTLGKVKLNKNKGTATLAVNVPGPGTLSLTGKNVKTQRPARDATVSKTVSAAGTVKLLVKPKGKAKTKLNKTGKAKVKVTVTYTPTGDAPGVPNTQTKTVKLIKKH